MHMSIMRNTSITTRKDTSMHTLMNTHTKATTITTMKKVRQRNTASAVSCTIAALPSTSISSTALSQRNGLTT